MTQPKHSRRSRIPVLPSTGPAPSQAAPSSPTSQVAGAGSGGSLVVPCDKCDGPNDRASDGNYCTACHSAYHARVQTDPEYRRVGEPWRPARDVDGLAPSFKPGPTHTRPAQVIRPGVRK